MLRPLALAAALALAAPAAAQTFSLQNAFPGASFDTPVRTLFAPGDPDRAYVVEQGVGGPARVRTAVLGSDDVTTYVDLSDRVEAGGEMGLLGMAFHPDYETNGRVYVSYTAGSPMRSVISELTRSTDDPLTADPESERVLLEIAQPFSNHNGGHILFGPDGYLYISIGDGGSGGDPQNNGQNRARLLGKLLRIDVDARTGDLEYGIPADNPFAGNTEGFREEIYAYGLRNAWRFSFDSATDSLWLADVGQGEWEEINVVRNGGNYGWKPVEGPECFVSGCDLSLYDAPVFWYGHNAAGGFSVTGGVVAHSPALPALEGRYLYADFVSDKLWALSAERPYTSQLLLTPSSPASIDYGPDGAVYVTGYNGAVWRLVQNGVAAEGAPGAGALALRVAGPQPFAGATAVEAAVPAGAAVRASLHDALGREVAVLFHGAAPASGALRLGVDGAGLAPGVYLVRVEAGGEAAVVRLVRTR